MPEKNAVKAQAGKAGGTVTLERYDPEQLRAWGKKGGRPEKEWQERWEK